ncbi:hypothetical protein V1509DRAFT_185678, partial [Lipomyces kononenkoae]
MLSLIQQQGQRIEQVADLLTHTQNLDHAPSSTDHVLAGDSAVNLLKRPRAKLPDADKFTAEDLSLFPQFLGKLQAKLEIDADAIGTGKDHVWYSFGRLEGKAAARIFPWMTAYKDTPGFTLENLYKQLRTAFEDPALQDKALNRLNTLRQGTRPFGELLSELDRLLLEAGGHGWDDAVKKGYIRAAVNQTLRDKLINIEEKPSYEEYCLQVKNIADRLAEFRRLSVNTRVNTGHFLPAARQDSRASAPEGSTNNDAMDWEPSAAKSSKRAKWVNKEELERRRQNGSCMRCGSATHFVKGCPFLPAKRPAGASDSRPGAHAVAEVDIDDATLDEDDAYGGKQSSQGK